MRRSRLVLCTVLLPLTAILFPRISAAAVEIHIGDQVTITIISAECASIGDVMSVSGPVSGVISTNACLDVGASITLGPSPSDGILSFVLNDPRFGSGTFQVQGSYPSYTVLMEDGYGDGDFNDNILSVVMTPDACDFFNSPPDDPLLADPTVQQAMKNLWKGSNPLDQSKAREQGGYIVERNGKTEMVPFNSNSNPDVCTATITGAEISQIQQSGGKILGFMHTHPHPQGSKLPAGGACKGITNPNARFGDGPSLPDETAAESSPWPSYVIDKDHVHRMDPFHTPGSKTTKIDRNRNCAKG